MISLLVILAPHCQMLHLIENSSLSYEFMKGDHSRPYSVKGDVNFNYLECIGVLRCTN